MLSVCRCTTTAAGAGRCSTPRRSSRECRSRCAPTSPGLAGSSATRRTTPRGRRPCHWMCPDKGLTPGGAAATRTTSTRWPTAGYTGKGTTIVFFAFDGFDQADLDTFADHLRPAEIHPEVVGGQPERGAAARRTMDLEVAHAHRARRQEGCRERPSDRRGCRRLREDRRRCSSPRTGSSPARCGASRSAGDATSWSPPRTWRRCVRPLATAHSHGTTAFDASGDLAGLECKGGQDWSAPPGPTTSGWTPWRRCPR